MYKVNENCIGCGACTAVCPEVFDLNDDGLAENIIGDVPAELDGSAKEAMESCPVAAIVNE
ncbi:ferredoxin [Candidatus Stoquefichus massiliensis]|uniref:ferredoxin n=1 Tax=Candidatus Stoquefichus massiliensis TaxID=1470350 RepID=UPI000486D510|nr:ferredoxin [Candidatus Stoquefichus massiliensis]